ncbi:TRAP transporter large permease [Microbacterium sp. No. 7]|uniref:TRAP transporter large permease n=1 Tax=Microbacterium sp. No. 7 TaxID=1714373 RepID=UPI0006ED397A|nr:TRAP transporter large permease [Microbacterium sp. No. 7]ALJ21688.1 C4-dicarboxylate ABC transporter permease [Microbacterium sp. No. 7]
MSAVTGAARRGTGTGWGIALGLSVVTAALLLFAPLPREVQGVAVIVLTIALILSGTHVAVAMMLASLIGLIALGGTRMAWLTLEDAVFAPVASWQLSVIPLFVLMGVAMWRSGVSGKAFEAARQWFGHVPGGLASGTGVAGAGLAAASGSTVGISYALGRVAIPEMLRSGYAPSLATGIVAMAGVLGQIIPPSTMLVIYAGVAQTPVGPQLIAGVVPGLVLTAAFALLITVRAIVTPGIAPRAELAGVTLGTRFRSLGGVVPLVAVIGIVIGGIALGVFTPTEAGAFGALASIVVGCFFSGAENRRPGAIARFLLDTFRTTAYSVAAVFLLLIAVTALTRVMTLSRVANMLATFVTDLGLTPVAFLLALIPLYLVLGMFLDTLAIILITTPVFLPIVLALGIDPVWFGVFLIVVAELAMVTPPVGLLSFIIHRLAQDPAVNLGRTVTLTAVFGGALWFVGVTVIVLVVMILVPQLVLWLPQLAAAG